MQPQNAIKKNSSFKNFQVILNIVKMLNFDKNSSSCSKHISNFSIINYNLLVVLWGHMCNN